jgi:hypothetical protein
VSGRSRDDAPPLFTIVGVTVYVQPLSSVLPALMVNDLPLCWYADCAPGMASIMPLGAGTAIPCLTDWQRPDTAQAYFAGVATVQRKIPLRLGMDRVCQAGVIPELDNVAFERTAHRIVQVPFFSASSLDGKF